MDKMHGQENEYANELNRSTHPLELILRKVFVFYLKNQILNLPTL